MTTDIDAARLRQLVADLETLVSAPGPGQFAAVNPDGTPGLVAAGELIESAWGNATANTLTKINAWTAYFASSVASPEVNFVPGGTVASIGNVTLLTSGNYLALGTAVVINRGAGVAQISLNMRVNSAVVGSAGAAWLNAANESVTLPFIGLVNVASGVRALDYLGVGNAGTPAVAGRSIALLRIQ